MFRTLVVFCALASVTHAEEIQYLIGPISAGGYTFTGSIVTDGAMGELTASDIVAWDWQANTTHVVGEGSSKFSEPYLSVGGLVATKTTLTMPFTGRGGGLSFGNNTSGLHAPDNLAFIIDTWTPSTYPGNPTYNNFGAQLGAMWYVNPGSYPTYWPLGTWSVQPDALLVATVVPEPSTLVLAALGLVALLAVRRHR